MTSKQKKLNTVFRIAVIVSFAGALAGFAGMLGIAGSDAPDMFDKEIQAFVYMLCFGGWVLLIGTVVSLVLSLDLFKLGGIISSLSRTALMLVSFGFQTAGFKGLRIVSIYCKVLGKLDGISADAAYSDVGLSPAEEKIIKDFIEGDGEALVSFIVALAISMLIFAVLAATSANSLSKQRNIPAIDENGGGVSMEDELAQYYQENDNNYNM